MLAKEQIFPMAKYEYFSKKEFIQNWY